jgi:hypothetical protein
MLRCFKPKKNIISPYEQYELWKQDLFLNKGLCECLCSTTFENDAIYAVASMFYDKKYDEPIGIKEYKKSYICYNINKKKTTDECLICLNQIQNTFSKKYITLECGHSYHKKCFTKYVQTKKKQNQIPTCPLCRFGMSENDEEILRIKAEKESRNNDVVSYSSYGSDY